MADIDPKLAAALSIGGVVVGFLLRWALPSARKAADVDLARAVREEQDARAEVERAKATPCDDDDVAAATHLAVARMHAIKQERLKAILDGIPA